MELFFEQPSKLFQIREISRIIKIAPTSVRIHLEELRKDNLLIKTQTSIYHAYIANTENRQFKIYKQIIFIKKLYETGLIDYLEDTLHPKCIILFGSIRKGEYTKNSDIDLFVQSEEKLINLSKFEKLLYHKINIIHEENIAKLSGELFNSIMNGIKLSGHLRIKQ